MNLYIREPLDELGLPYWHDRRLDSTPIQDWWEETAKQVVECPFFTFLLTEEWQYSAECQREYKTALEHGKEILPVAPFDLDFAPAFAHLRRSYQISFAFRKDGRTALKERYAAAARTHEERTAQKVGESERPNDLQEILAGIIKDNDSICILGRGNSKSLREVFVPLRLTKSGDTSGHSLALRDVLAHEVGNQVIVSGGPGSGKSTLLQYLQVLGARSDFPFLSARITFRGLASKKVSVSAWLDSYTSAHYDLPLAAFGGRKPEASNGLLVLLDGLDEIGAGDYERLSHEVVKLTDSYPGIKVILATRPNGFEPADFDGFLHLSVMPLTDQDVREYVNTVLATPDANRLLALIASSERIAELVETPFLLALLSAAHIEVATDTRERAALFKSAINYLLKGEDWDTRRTRASAQEIDYEFRILKRIAIRLFMLESNGLFPESELLQCISSEKNLEYSAEITLDAIVKNSGLLQYDRDGYYFVHRSVWEYLVAAACLDEPLSSVAERSVTRRWEEPIRLYIGSVSEQEVEPVIRAIWDQNPSLALRGMTERPAMPRELLADLYGRCTLEQRLRILADVERLRDRVSSRREFERILGDTARVIIEIESNCQVLYSLLSLLQHSPVKDLKTLSARILQEDTLPKRLSKYVADGRFYFSFSDIAAGEFDMGIDTTDEREPADASERPQHRVVLDQYSVSKFLVTNRLYYDLFPYVIDRRNEYSRDDKQPVNNVNWYEAVLFARWLGCDLPTDAEWEFMARGSVGDHEALNNLEMLPEYAWHGANSNNTTHPVGLKLPNSRDVYDVAGNLREWCLDWYDLNYYEKCRELGLVHNPIGPLTGERKVLRGGTFDWAAWNLRPTYRNSNTPDNRNHVTGFRLLVRPDSMAYQYIKEGKGK
jgi:formylglycine-generating enzyme required for sulfatase activity